jgi:hypothetical protein
MPWEAGEWKSRKVMEARGTKDAKSTKSADGRMSPLVRAAVMPAQAVENACYNGRQIRRWLLGE